MFRKVTTGKAVANPFKNKNVGRRTGKDIKAGKNIRKTSGGFDNFDDYWSESEADATIDGTFAKPNTPVAVEAVERKTSENSSAMPGKQSESAVSSQPVLVQSQTANVKPVKNALNPFRNKQIGRRTGKDMKAGKNIRILDGGFENFDDYWSESDADSVISFSTTSSRARVPSRHGPNGLESQENNSTVTAKASPRKSLDRRSSGRAANHQHTEKKKRSSQGANANRVQSLKKNRKVTQDTEIESVVSEDACIDKDSDTCGEVVIQEEGETTEKENKLREINTTHCTDNREDVDSAKEEEHQQEGSRRKDDNSRPQENGIIRRLFSDVLGDNEAVISSLSKKPAERQANISLAHLSGGPNRVLSGKRQSNSSQANTSTAHLSGSPNRVVSGKKQSNSSQANTSTAHLLDTPNRIWSGKRQYNSHATKQSTSILNAHSSLSSINFATTDKIPPCEDEAMSFRNKNMSSNRLVRDEDVSSEGESIADEEPEPDNRDTSTKKLQPTAHGTRVPQDSEENVDSPGGKSQVRRNMLYNSQTSQKSSAASQMDTANALASSQQSSTLLTATDDVTGSITRLNNNSRLSPENRLYGIRKRLSYAESPRLEHHPKANVDRKRCGIPQPRVKLNSRKQVSSPVPEDPEEFSESTERQHAKSGPQSTQEDDGRKMPSRAASVSNKYLQALPSSEQAANSAADTGMFLSLVSHPQNSAALASLQTISESEDEEFEILKEGKVYRAPKESKKPTKGTNKPRKTTETKSMQTGAKGKKEPSKIPKWQKNKTNNRNAVKEIDNNSSPPDSEDREISLTTAPSSKGRLKKQANTSMKGSSITSHSEDAESSMQSGKPKTGKRTSRKKQVSAQEKTGEPSKTNPKRTQRKSKQKNSTRGNESFPDEDSRCPQKKRAQKGTARINTSTRSSQVYSVIVDSDLSDPEEEIPQKKAKIKNKSDNSSNVEAVKDNSLEETILGQGNGKSRKVSAQQKSVQRAKQTKKGTKQSKQNGTIGEVATGIAQGKSSTKTKTMNLRSGSKRTEAEGNNDRQSADRHVEENHAGDESVHASAEVTRENRKRRGKTEQRVSSAKKSRKASMDIYQKNKNSDLECEDAEDFSTPVCHSLSDLEQGDSALRSGISFRHSLVASSLKLKQSWMLRHKGRLDLDDDIISSPMLAMQSEGRQGMHHTVAGNGQSMSVGKGSLAQNTEHIETPKSANHSCITSRAKKNGTENKKKRRVTINKNVTHHFCSPKESMESDCSTRLPSMSTTPVHYYHIASPMSPLQERWEENKIVHPDNKTSGLRRSQRTRVKPLEWYKNERIVYDRRRSGPVIMAVKPSREHIYMEQENLKRRKRKQKNLMIKKQQLKKGRPSKRLSTQVSLPTNLNVTNSTEICVLHPETEEEVLMSCFNPAAKVSAIGPQGNEPSPADPFSLKLITEQNLFTTGVLTLAPASEKPLQRAISTAVIYFITYGKILVSINRASTILQTGDHFFVPKGTVYRLQNLRYEEATLNFTNLMVDMDEGLDSGQPD